MYNSFLSFIIAVMLTRNSADARNCASPNQILTKPVALSVSLQSDWDNHKVEF